MKHKLYNPRLKMYVNSFLNPHDGCYYSKPAGKGIKFNKNWEPNKIEPFKDFLDGRGREWEWFYDLSYFEAICVRLKEDRAFNSPTSFHFNTLKEASNFAFLLSKSS